MVFEATGIEIQKAYLDKSIDVKLATRARLKTLQLEDVRLEIKEQMTIDETVKVLECQFKLETTKRAYKY